MIIKPKSKTKTFAKLIQNNKPTLRAQIFGASNKEPYGTADFYIVPGGVLILAEIFALPKTSGKCSGRFFAFHIHEGGFCTGNMEDPFADTKGHYNPENCEHPFHKGDLPPLFSQNGYAFLCVFKNGVTAYELIGKTIVIHDMPDDFNSQPSGNSGKKIACGEIRKL